VGIKKLWESFWDPESSVDKEFSRISKLGSESFEKKKYFEAIAYFDEAFRLIKNMGFFDSFFGIDDEYLLRGRAKLEIGDYKGAKKDFKKSKESRDTDYYFIYEEYFYRGIAKFYLNDFKGALKDFYRSKLNDKDEFIFEEIEEWIQKTKLKDV
tara:strand:+ start:1160 stop:1621 length:462 start_codon:yes stop_codon:yes gene_type:complete